MQVSRAAVTVCSRACHRWPNLFLEKRLGSISMYFDILERIRFMEKNDLNMRYEDKWI